MPFDVTKPQSGNSITKKSSRLHMIDSKCRKSGEFSARRVHVFTNERAIKIFNYFNIEMEQKTSIGEHEFLKTHPRALCYHPHCIFVYISMIYILYDRYIYNMYTFNIHVYIYKYMVRVIASSDLYISLLSLCSLHYFTSRISFEGSNTSIFDSKWT